MKRFYLAFIVPILASCGKKHLPPPLHATQICVVYNITETLVSPPLAEPIISVFDFNIDKDQQADFRMVLLHGTLLNAAQSIHLDGLNSHTISEELENHAQMTISFSNSVRAAITEFPRQYGTGQLPARIECFATIAKELEILAGSIVSQRALIVFGSLAENDPAFSSRSFEGKQLLKTKPEKVIHILQKRHKLPDNLVGISVFFVFQPMNETEAVDNAVMVRIYQRLLRERGARVIIQSDNKNFQP